MPPRMRRRITTATREEIDRQQKALAKSINRPFDLVANLPVSYNEPGSYELVFKNPLTVKDTGVLYLSLLRSRHCYVYEGPMFALYWIKQSAYAKKMAAQDSKYYEKVQNDPNSDARQPILLGDVSARDVMVKLCDGTLDLGPHTFEIRMFIAKDERSEKKKKKDKDIKEEGKDLNQESTPAPTTSTPSGSSHPGPSPLPVPAPVAPQILKAPEPNSEPPTVPQNSEDKLSATVDTGKENSHVSKSTPAPQPATQSNSAPEPSTNPNDTESTKEALSTKDATSTKNTEPTNSSSHILPPSNTPPVEPSTTPPTVSSAPRQRITLTNLRTKVPTKDTTSPSTSPANHIPPPTVPIARPQVKVGTTSNGSNVPAPNQTNEPSTSQPPQVEPRPISPPTVRAPPPRSDPSNMQSVENTIMIANLNAIARVDASLNSLMKIVALGNASPQQIMTFQGYIQRAREMGPQPHHAYLFPNYFQNGRYVKSGAVRDRKPKVPRDQKLTAFQEKYVKDATVLFEFAENSNVRYALPKDAIAEVLPQTKENIEADEKDILFSFLWVHNQKEVDEYEAKKKEYEDFMKKKEEDAKKKAEEEEAARKEAEEKQREDDEKIEKEVDDVEMKETEQDNDKEKAVEQTENSETGNKETESTETSQPIDESKDDEGSIATKDSEEPVKKEASETVDENTSEAMEISSPAPTRRLPPRRGKKGKRAPPPRKPRPPKEPEMPTEPEIRYTAMSFTIHKVPTRFVPIVANSVNPVEKVQEKMKHILETGTRTSNYYLWYQVDGKQDEALAEKIRVQLHQEEKKLNGIVVSGSGTTTLGLKKRKLMKADPIKKAE